MPGDRGKTEPASADISLALLVQVSIAAWIFFSAICLLFGFSYHTSSTEIWTLITLVAVVLIMVVAQNWRQWHEASVHKVSVIVALWLFAALILGSWVGLFAFDCCIGEYWMTQKLEARMNVLPAEPAAAYANAGSIIFADEARVDPGKSVGYKDGSVFCVAPVASDAPMDTVQFWAVGLDCCGARGTFVCDDAWNPKAHAGVVIRNSTFYEELRNGYLKAVKLAEVTYDIASNKEPIFVRWVSNPNQVELNIWRAGFGVLLAAIIISALVCGLQACGMHVLLRWGRRSK